MSNSNLGLNRKISSIVSKEFNRLESDIYKQISKIASEYGDEADDDSGIVAIIERGKDNVTEFKEKRITVITQDMFSDFTNLTYLYLPNVTVIDYRAFTTFYHNEHWNYTEEGGSQIYPNIKHISLPSLYIINDETFALCSSLKTINFKNAMNIGIRAFYRCYGLISVNLPNAISIGVRSFGYCDSLVTVYFPNVTSINNYAFSDCINLTTVIFPYNGVITSDVEIFNNTPIANGTGYIYVPDSLVNSYKSDTMWSTYASQIKPISELPQEYKTLYNIT